MKAKRLLNPASSKDGHPQALYCELHPQEEIERVCSLSNCRRRPLLCWQCLLDDKEHAESHRQHFLKLPDFFEKFADEHEELLKARRLQEMPPELEQLVAGEEANVGELEQLCESARQQLEEEFEALRGELNILLSRPLESLKEALDKKLELYRQSYALLRARVEEFHGLGKPVTPDSILEEVNLQKENSSVSEYFLGLKQSLLPRVPLLKDPGFTSLWGRVNRMREKTAGLEEAGRVRRAREEVLKAAERNIKEVQNELFAHFKLDLKAADDSLSAILKRSAGPNPSKPPVLASTVKLQETVVIIEPKAVPPPPASKVSLTLRKSIKTSHSKQINAIKVINEELLATASKDGTIRLYRFYSKECLATLQGHKDSVCCLGLLPASSRKALPTLISGGGNFDSSLMLWDLEARKLRLSLPGHKSSVTAVLGFADGRTMASGSYDNNMILWDCKDAKALFVMRKHSAMVSALRLLRNGEVLASASWDKTVALWRLEFAEGRLQKCEFLFSILENFAILTLGSALLEPDRLLYAGTNKKFFAFNLERREKEREFEGSHFGVNELVVVESSFLESYENFLVIGLSNNDACLRVWEGSSGAQVFCLKDNENSWINNLNTGPKIEVFNNFENRTQVAMLNNSPDGSFFVNLYDLVTE